jgi:cytochrome b
MRQAGARNHEFEAAYVSERIVPMRVWDAPTRLFHWALVILLGTSWLTESRGWMQLHFLSGYSIITLLLFRVAWGFAGSQTARFSHFIRGPWAALRHFAHLLRREPDTEIGHNAAGGWMVLVMLALLAVQVSTGLFANDDANTEGPLFSYVGKEQSDWLSHIHAVNFMLIKIAVVLHVVAILIYLGLARHDLVRPMITGRKLLPVALSPPRLVSPLRAAALFAIAVGLVGVAVNVW